MAQPVLHQCPLDGGPVEVTEISCLNCDVQIRGHFTLSRYDRLDAEQARFLETFLRCRGVIRDVEAALGISYPTVKARIESLLTTLDLGESTPPPAEEPDKSARRREILASIDTGALSAEAGLQALQELA